MALPKRVLLYSTQKYDVLLKLTFDSDIDGLRNKELWLDQHAADVSPLIHSLLNVTELQRSILKHNLKIKEPLDKSMRPSASYFDQLDRDVNLAKTVGEIKKIQGEIN